MQLERGKYLLMLCLEIFFIAIDIMWNAVTETISVRKSSTVLLLLFIIQDAFQLLAITVLCISIFRTNVFKTGFLELVVERFRASVLVGATYLLVTLALHVNILTIRWHQPLKHSWPLPLLLVYILQRTLSVVHYYLYKRAALRLSDPRYYDEEWVKHALAHE